MSDNGVEITFLGFPTLYDFFHGDRLLHSFTGSTMRDLLEGLFRRYGETMKESLWDPRTNRLDPAIQIVVNGRYVEGDRDDLPLSDGDRVKFMRLLAGG